MRIVAGRFKGLRLHTPPKGGPTRPTTDRVRESLFSVIADRIRGARFLDLYGGTGAISLEAVSRGAAEVVTVECHPRALAVILKNLDAVKRPPEILLRRQRVELYLRSAKHSFDVIFADPPFKIPPQSVIEMVGASRVLGPETLFLIEYRRDQSPNFPEPPDPPPGFSCGRTYRAGEKELTAYHAEDPSPAAGEDAEPLPEEAP
jgi:16S rRNA (guanine966-N2)-methyltransferase